MRAIRVHRPTGSSGVQVDEVADPRPGPGEVAVRILAAGLNHIDLLLVRGKLVPVPEFPHTIGIEGAGRVVEVGAGVESRRVGQGVTIYPYVGCGSCRFCLLGQDQVCAVGQIRCVGFTLPGTMAEIVVVPARNAVPLPEGVSEMDAAAVSIAGMSAYRLVTRSGESLLGQRVLIRAVGSGVGTVALQLAKAGGAWVVGTAGSDAKLERARALGLDAGINHATEDVVARVKELTERAGVSLVLDYVGSATWDEDVRCLGRGGSLALCGAHTGSEVSLNLWHLFAKELSFRGSYGGSRSDLRETLGLLGRKALRPVVDRVLTADEVPAGLEAMESRDHFGKILVTFQETATSD